jgi:uncharacterized membrane protein YbhN (UPF0104 family)
VTTARRFALVGVWVLATALLVACARTVDWTRAIDALASMKPGWLTVGVVGNAAILAWWALFWRTLLPVDDTNVRASYGRMFEIVAIASALMNTVPFGGGHASSVALLARRAPTSMRSALSVMALDQLGEGLTKVTIFLLVAVLAPLPAWMRAGVTTACVGVAAWFVALVVASRWASELAILKSLPRALGAWGCVLAMKGAELAAIVAVQHAFGLNIPFSGSLLVLAAVVLGTMLPLAPGNLGTYEASAFLVYRYLGVTPEQALSIAVVQHACFMIPSVGIGYAFLSVRTLARMLARSAVASR